MFTYMFENKMFDLGLLYKLQCVSQYISMIQVSTYYDPDI